MRTVTTLLLKLSIAASVLAAPQAFAADNKSSEMKKNAWETVCDQGVIAACRKAGSLLEEKMLATDDDKEEAQLRDRLVHVSRIGCEKNDLGACSLLFNAGDDKKDMDLAKQVADRQCKAGEKSACEQLERFEEPKDARIDLTDLDSPTKFDTEFASAFGPATTIGPIASK